MSIFLFSNILTMDFKASDQYKKMYSICQQIDKEFQRDENDPLYKKFHFYPTFCGEETDGRIRLFGNWIFSPVNVAKPIIDRVEERLLIKDTWKVREDL